MRRILHNALGGLRGLCIGGGGLALAAFAGAHRLGMEPLAGWWTAGLRAVEAAPEAVIAAGAALAVVEALYWLSVPRLPGVTDELIYHGSTGEVTVATDLVVNELRDLAEEFSDLVMLEPTVVPRRNAMEVDLDLKVRSGCATAQLCRALHDRVHELVEERFGMFEMGEVRLHIREIIRDGAPAGGDAGAAVATVNRASSAAPPEASRERPSRAAEPPAEPDRE